MEIHGSLDREAHPDRFAALQAEMNFRGPGFIEESKAVASVYRAELAASEGGLGSVATWKTIALVFSMLVSLISALSKCSGD